MADQNKLIELVTQRYPGDAFVSIEEKKKIKESKLAPKNKKKLGQIEAKELLETEKEYKDALAYIKDVISPAFMQTYSDKIKINNVYAKTFFVYAYPSFLE